MTIQDPHGFKSPSDDTIDLYELVAVLLRHKLWVFALTSLGFALALLGLILHKPSQKICLLVNISDGPRLLRKEYGSFDYSNIARGVPEVGAPVLALPVQANLDEVISRLQIISHRALPLEFVKGIKIAPSVFGNFPSTTQAELCYSAASASQAREIMRFLAVIQRDYKSSLMEEYSLLPGFQDPMPNWVQLIKYPSENRKVSNYIALGLMSGFFVGCTCALIADRRQNRVYNYEQLLGLLGCQLRAKLPIWPWDMPGAQAEIRQLAMQINPDLSWVVLSIGQHHPMVAPLAKALQTFAPYLELTSTPPLLAEPVMPSDMCRPVGILVVVERGFNSAAALKESRRVLTSLAFVQEVGAVLIGAALPPELTIL